MTASRALGILASLTVAITAAGLSACTTPRSVPPSSPTLAESSYTSFDGDRLPYRKWLPKGDTTLVVVGFHGIAGASVDMGNLGKHLRQHLPGAAVYAPDLRGQGLDPRVSRRGDIRHREDWILDARTFSRLVRKEHPDARVVWCGESMGSLIALHTTAGTTPPPCDALILSSPVVRIGEDIPAWRLHLLRLASCLAPKKRISLESISGEDTVQVTRGEVHQDQAATNPWHVPEFSLRLLSTLEHLIRTAPETATQVKMPVLILHGGGDIFSKPADIAEFTKRFPGSAERHYYPESYHLLFYDHEREQVLADVTRWLKGLPDSR